MQASIVAASLWLWTTSALTILPLTKTADSSKSLLASGTSSLLFEGIRIGIDDTDPEFREGKPVYGFNHTWEATVEVFNETDGISSLVSFHWNKDNGPSEQRLPLSFDSVDIEDRLSYTSTTIIPGLYERLGINCTGSRSCAKEMDYACLLLMESSRRNTNNTMVKYPGYQTLDLPLHPICFGAPYNKSDLQSISELYPDEPKERIQGNKIVWRAYPESD